MNKEKIQELLNLAEQKIREEQIQFAANLCNQVLKEVDSAQAKFLLSTCYTKRNRHDEAIELSKELAIDDKGISNLAMVYAKSGQNDKATKEYRKAITKPNCDPVVHSNYILHLRDIGEIDECLGYLKYITKAIPNSDSLWYTYGTINFNLNKFIEAKECYLKAIKVKSTPLIHYDLSLTYFHLGEYKEGWKHYESRWQACWLFDLMRKQVPGKFWQGENLKDKSILLWCEQGIGDLVLFFRYAKELEVMGASVYLKYEDPLFRYPLLGKCPDTPRSYFPTSSTGFGSNTNYPYDYNCSILTVAGILGADVKTTSGKPYLKSTLPALPKDDKRKIGLCWCGSPGHPKDKERSIKLKEFGIDKAYSLVKDYFPKKYDDGEIVDWDEGHKNLAIDLSSYLKDLNHTAQVIEWLDVVVTVDTVVAHIAGVVGKKTYLMLPFNCDWRWWDEKKETTPWYDCVTLIRQEKAGKWDMDKLRSLLNNADDTNI